MKSSVELAELYNLRPTRGRSEWRGTCPLCGYNEAFSLTERHGRHLFWCFSCQDRRALGALAAGLGAVVTSPANCRHPTIDAAAKQAKAWAIWNGAANCMGTPASVYLAARGLPALAMSPALRFRRDASHPNRRGPWPAMVALVRDVGGNPVGIHRTYLRADGAGKADVEPSKASLGHVWRGAIRLDPVAQEIVVGEGIETSASAGALLGLPAWSAISAGNLADALALPLEVRSVVIAADHDHPGICAAKAAASRWKGEGRSVRIVLPSRQDWDFNDELCAQEAYHE